MRKIIVMAEEGELSLLDKAKEQLGLDLRDAQLIYTGVGAINIIRSLAGLDRDAEVYNIGYVGSANFEIGTWVEVTEVRLNHPNVTYPEPELQLSPIINHQSPITNHQSPIIKSVCYTNTDFVLASDYKDCVFDMELAFIASLGFKQLHSLKYVSDNLSLHTYHDLTHGVE
ncbi:MAG: hypothetical protein SPF23_07940 [Paludibacteraceae bacterium]|nr:hypothetical protein [Bacteroidales bacterium]MDY5651943.1 hypothetical protein [Paludibacteraceae bacterium]